MGDLSNNLSRYEVACKCGCGFATADIVTVKMFEQARKFEGNKPVAPNSWCRCHHYNEIVQMDANENYIPNSSKSKHMEGIACDFPSDNPKALFDYLDNLYLDSCGIGVYNSFVHFDSRLAKARWDRRSG